MLLRKDIIAIILVVKYKYIIIQFIKPYFIKVSEFIKVLYFLSNDYFISEIEKFLYLIFSFIFRKNIIIYKNSKLYILYIYEFLIFVIFDYF